MRAGRSPGKWLVCLALAFGLCGCAGAAEQPSAAPEAAAGASSAPAPPPSSAPPVPESAKVRARLAKVSRVGTGSTGVAVLTDNGTVVATRQANKTFAPASTLKVLTSLAVVDTLGEYHIFTTKVVQASSGRIVLVGGGDPLLTDKASKSAAKPASLEALAKATAKRLKASGVKKVSLGYDATLFKGPDFNPGWKSKWRKFLSRVSSLTIGEGRFNPWQSDPKPASTAANSFAKRLRAAGITVTGVKPSKAPAQADELASVGSAPLGTIVGRTLRYSDNHAAEVLARHLALATGAEPSFAGAAGSLKTWLLAQNLWESGMRVVDGSGLSARSRVTPTVLAKSVAHALSTPSLSVVADGLPVAGKKGTLEKRFNDASERAGLGNVHAKTGTLPGIGALAGYLTTKDGTRLVFAAIANKASGQTTVQNWLDRTAAALVKCGCG